MNNYNFNPQTKRNNPMLSRNKSSFYQSAPSSFYSNQSSYSYNRNSEPSFPSLEKTTFIQPQTNSSINSSLTLINKLITHLTLHQKNSTKFIFLNSLIIRILNSNFIKIHNSYEIVLDLIKKKLISGENGFDFAILFGNLVKKVKIRGKLFEILYFLYVLSGSGNISGDTRVNRDISSKDISRDDVYKSSSSLSQRDFKSSQETIKDTVNSNFEEEEDLLEFNEVETNKKILKSFLSCLELVVTSDLGGKQDFSENDFFTFTHNSYHLIPRDFISISKQNFINQHLLSLPNNFHKFKQNYNLLSCLNLNSLILNSFLQVIKAEEFTYHKFTSFVSTQIKLKQFCLFQIVYTMSSFNEFVSKLNELVLSVYNIVNKSKSSSNLSLNTDPSLINLEILNYLYKQTVNEGLVETIGSFHVFNGDLISAGSLVNRVFDKCLSPFNDFVFCWIGKGECLNDSEFLFTLNENTNDEDGDIVWNRYKLVKYNIDFLNKEVVRRIYVIGKSIQFTKSTSVTEFFIPDSVTSSSFITYVNKQYDLLVVKGLMQNFIFTKCKLFVHLRALRDYFLLGKGDFYEELIENVYYGTNGTSCVGNVNLSYLLRHVLLNALDEAIDKSSSKFDDQNVIERLDLRVVNHNGDLLFDYHSSSNEINGFEATNEMVKLLLNENCKVSYSQCFGVLFRIRRVQVHISRLLDYYKSIDGVKYGDCDKENGNMGVRKSVKFTCVSLFEFGILLGEIFSFIQLHFDSCLKKLEEMLVTGKLSDFDGFLEYYYNEYIIDIGLIFNAKLHSTSGGNNGATMKGISAVLLNKLIDLIESAVVILNGYRERQSGGGGGLSRSSSISSLVVKWNWSIKEESALNKTVDEARKKYNEYRVSVNDCLSLGIFEWVY